MRDSRARHLLDLAHHYAEHGSGVERVLAHDLREALEERETLRSELERVTEAANRASTADHPRPDTLDELTRVAEPTARRLRERSEP